jgi:hypothetical protein
VCATLVGILPVLELALLLFLGGVREFDVLWHHVTLRVAEGVGTDDRELAQ